MSLQLSNHEATEGRVLESAGIGMEGYFQAHAQIIVTTERMGRWPDKGQTDCDRKGVALGRDTAA
jgi:hypothetical protein